MKKSNRDGRKKPSTHSKQSAQARLSKREKKQLRRAETTIKKGFASFLKVGLELKKIRDGKLYRQAYKTWAAYCLKRWVMTRTHAERLIAAAKLAQEKLKPKGIRFSNEGQLRELTRLTPLQITKAVKKARTVAREENLPLTAALVAKQIRKHRGAGIEPRFRLPSEARFAMKFEGEMRPVVTGGLKKLAPKVEAFLRSDDDMENGGLDLFQEVCEFLGELQHVVE